MKVFGDYVVTWEQSGEFKVYEAMIVNGGEVSNQDMGFPWEPREDEMLFHGKSRWEGCLDIRDLSYVHFCQDECVQNLNEVLLFLRTLGERLREGVEVCHG